MIPLQLFVVWCFINSGAIAKGEKREVIAPEIVRGGFAASNGPYGNEASASTLNYQAGDRGNYNNIDAYNGYNNNGNYNGATGNIPVQEQPDVQTQNVRVPVWSPPNLSQNPYTAPPQQQQQQQANPIPQTELIQVPIQQGPQIPFQPEPQIQQQQHPIYLPQEQVQQGYQEQIPQQYPDIPSYQNNAPSFFGDSSSINDPSAYRTLPPAESYSNGIQGQSNLPHSISSAANIAATYGNSFQPHQPAGIPQQIPIGGLPPLRGRGLPLFPSGVPSISSGTPSRFVGRSFGRRPSISSSSSLSGNLHSLDDVLGGGISDFDTSSFSGSFGGGFGHGGFGLGGFGSNYFGGLGGGLQGFGGFGSSPFSSGFTFGGLKGGLRGNNGPKFPNISPISTFQSNSIPIDGKIPSGANISDQQIPANLGGVQDGGSQNIPSQQDVGNQPIQAPAAKN